MFSLHPPVFPGVLFFPKNVKLTFLVFLPSVKFPNRDTTPFRIYIQISENLEFLGKKKLSGTKPTASYRLRSVRHRLFQHFRTLQKHATDLSIHQLGVKNHTWYSIFQTPVQNNRLFSSLCTSFREIHILRISLTCISCIIYIAHCLHRAGSA